MVLRNGLILAAVSLGSLCLIAACEDRLSRLIMAGLSLYLWAVVYAWLTRRGD